MVTRIFEAPVNVRTRSGGYTPVDTTLAPAAVGAVQPRATRYEASLPRDLSDPVTMSAGGDGISFALRGAQGSRTTAGSTATYRDALDGVDVRYTAGPSALKEQLLLADATARRSFVFDLDPTKGLRPKLNKAGGVDLVDAVGAVSGVVAAPVMTDARGVSSRAVRYSLRRATSGGGWTLGVRAGSKWLDAADRAWPVDVDPTVSFSDTFDTYMASGNDPPNGADAQYGPVTYFTVSTNGDRLRRALLKFNVSSIPRDAVVEGAKLNLHTSGQAGSNTPIEAHAVTRSFTGGATWNRYDGTNAWTTPGGDFDEAALDSINVGADGWYQWTIGNAVQDWVSGDNPNNGLLLKAPVEAVNQPGGGQGATFWGSLNGASTPYIDISWEAPTGTLPQWTYDTQKINDRSDLKVNVATGNLILTANDIKVAGVGGFDLNVSRTYNSRGQWFGNMGFQTLMNAGNDVWSSNYNNGATKMIHGPGDVYWRFRKHYTSAGAWDGTYDTPPGVNATLTSDSTGDTLRMNRTGVTMFFDSTKIGPYHGQSLGWVKDRNGHKISYGYDANGRLSSITDTQGRTYAIARNTNPFQEVSTITDASYPGGARTWSYGYTQQGSDPNFQGLSSYTDPAGKTTSYAYTGYNLTRITDPRGNQIRISYTRDANGYPQVRTVTRVTNTATGQGPTTLYCYDTANQKTTVYDPNGNSGAVGADDCASPTAAEQANKVIYSYDNKDQVTKATSQIGQDTSSTYSPNGDPLTLTGQAQAGSSGQAPTVFGYDSNFNATSELDPAGEKASAAYDTGTGTGGGQAGHQYLMTSSADQSGGQRYYGYDPAGNVTRVGDAMTSPANKADLAYTDGSETGNPPVGLVKSSTDGNGNTTTYTYYGSGDGTKTGDLKQILPPLTGGRNPGQQSFTYDAESRVATMTDGKGTVTTYGYDKLDRLASVSTPAKTFTYTYDQNGNLTGRTDATNTSSFTYDELNRRTAETVAGSSKNYGYDANGNQTSLTDAWGTTSYTYFADNRVKTITDPANQTVSYAYTDTTSPRKQTITYPGTTGTLTTSTDLSGKLTAIDAKTTGSTERKLTYSYVPVSGSPGQLIDTETEYQKGSATASAAWKYKYDPLTRLCAATTGTLPSACPTASTASLGSGVYGYVYDNASNRVAKINGATKTTYAYDAANELCWTYTGTSANPCGTTPTGATTYNSDANGNRTTGSLSYDAFNRLSNIGGSNALTSLAPDNSELVGDGTATLTNSQIGLDSYSTGGARTDYIRDPQGTLIGEHTSTATRYVTPDSRGSTRWLWNGATVDRAVGYDPDGNPITPPGGTGTGIQSKIGYASGYLAGASTSTPLYHYGARYYDPVTAQWTQRDPLLQPGDLRQANPYLYVGGDPLNAVDPTGESLFDVVKTVAKGAVRVVTGVACGVGIERATRGAASTIDNVFTGASCVGVFLK